MGDCDRSGRTTLRHNIVVHVRTLFGGDASNNPRFIYAAFHFSKRPVVTFTISSRSSQEQPSSERSRTLAEWLQCIEGLDVQPVNALLRGGYSNDRRMRRFCALTVGSAGFAERRRITNQVEQIILNLGSTVICGDMFAIRRPLVNASRR
jgi:hypothetical protein